MLCIEQNGEWSIGRGYLSAESISRVLADPEKSSVDQIKEQITKKFGEVRLGARPVRSVTYTAGSMFSNGPAASLWIGAW